MQRTIALTVVGLAGFAAACSSDGEKVADQINAEAARKLGTEGDELSTTCPGDAKAKEGETFECTVEIEGQALPVLIEFTSDDDFTFQFDGAALAVDELEASLKEELAAADHLGERVTELDCPGDAFLVIAADETVECDGTTASGSEGSVVVGLDNQGNPVIVDLEN